MAGGTCAACGSNGSSSCVHCGCASYCSQQCLQSHWPVHKEVCGLKARGSPGPSAASPSLPGADTSAPLRFSAKDIADAARSVLREGEQTAAPKGSSAAEQQRLLRSLAESAAARTEASTAAPPPGGGTALSQAPGLRELQAAINQAEAEEAWAAQAAAGEAAQLPRLHALISCEIDDEQQYNHFVHCIQSICKQWRAPPEHSLVSWHAEGEELREKVQNLMREFTQAIEGGGARIAYSEGPIRAVRCRVTSVEQPARLTRGEHIQRLLEHIPSLDTSWLLVADSDCLWHPGRTAFFRNFTRQVPGPEKCVAAVAPLLARPTSAASAAGNPFASALEVNKMLQQGDPGVVVKEELAELAQYCVRRSVMAGFFEAHSEAVVKHELCFARMLSFVGRENGQKCLQVAPEQFRTPDGSGAPMWMIFCRRPSPLPLLPARASGPDVALAGGAPGPVEEPAAVIAALRREVQYLVLRQWGSKNAQELSELALESIDLECKADGEIRQKWLVPLAESLATQATEVFGLKSEATN